MHSHASLVRRIGAAITTVTCLILASCGAYVPPGSADSLASTIAGIGDSERFAEDQDNNAFDSAEFFPASTSNQLIEGKIDSAKDVDVYDLGFVEAGDRIVVDMAPGPELNAAIAVFDDTGTTLLVNDHRNLYLGKSEPFIDVIFPFSTAHCYIAVSATPGFTATGSYSLVTRREDANPTAAGTASTKRPDIVLLDFAGAKGITIGSRAAVDVPPFDAGQIASKFSPQTDEIVKLTTERVRKDFTGLDIQILSTADGDVYERGMTRIYFGTYDPGLLGVAEGVDEFNSYNAQEAMIFTDTFQVFMKVDPSADELATALANVTSHEIGHLMGLVHTKDITGIMDVTASLDQLMVDQSFAWSELYAEVFPLGWQHAPQYLVDVLGGDEDVVFSRFEASRQKAIFSSRNIPGPPARDHLHFSSSCHHALAPE